MRSRKIIALAIIVIAVWTAAATAEMSRSDFRGAMSVMEALSDAVPQYELCDVNTKELLDLVEEVLLECDVSQEQYDELKDYFLEEAQQRADDLLAQGYNCSGRTEEMQDLFDDRLIPEVRSALRREPVC